MLIMIKLVKHFFKLIITEAQHVFSSNENACYYLSLSFHFCENYCKQNMMLTIAHFKKHDLFL